MERQISIFSYLVTLTGIQIQVIICSYLVVGEIQSKILFVLIGPTVLK